MSWQVVLKRKVVKELPNLPTAVREVLAVLLKEIELLGPVRGNWKNYGKLSSGRHHCHLKSGRPTYVACWEVLQNSVGVEVYYVGTHEKAPY